MVKAKWLPVSFILLSLTVVTGCWDRTEIEDTGIILGIGMDRSMTQNVAESVKYHQISMTHHFAVPKEMAGNQSTGKQKPYVNLTNEGDTVFEIIRDLSTRIARPPNYEHLKVIVISEDIAKSIDLREIVDFFLRNPETRRTVKVVVAKGKARDVLEKTPPIAANPALKLFELTENTKKTLRMAPEINLGDMSERLTGQSSFMIQEVDTLEKETKITGAAVINGKRNKMVGWLSEQEIEGINWVSGKGKAGLVDGIDRVTGEVMVYEVQNMKSRIQPKVKGDQISFTVEIETDGALREDWVISGDSFKEEYIKRAERATNEKIKFLARKALDKTQKEFEVDIFGFGKKLSIYYPKVWKKVKKNWDQTFSEVPVEVTVKVNIRDFGTRGTKM